MVKTSGSNFKAYFTGKGKARKIQRITRITLHAIRGYSQEWFMNIIILCECVGGVSKKYL